MQTQFRAQARAGTGWSWSGLALAGLLGLGGCVEAGVACGSTFFVVGDGGTIYRHN